MVLIHIFLISHFTKDHVRANSGRCSSFLCLNFLFHSKISKAQTQEDAAYSYFLITMSFKDHVKTNSERCSSFLFLNFPFHSKITLQQTLTAAANSYFLISHFIQRSCSANSGRCSIIDQCIYKIKGIINRAWKSRLNLFIFSNQWFRIKSIIFLIFDRVTYHIFKVKVIQ